MSATFVTLIELGEKTATGFAVPAEVVTALGSGKRPKVLVTLGAHTYRSTIVVYGGTFMLPLSAVNREAAGVAAGDEVEVTVELDTAERTVEVPDDLAAALGAHPGARAAFDRLSYTAQRERAEAVASAKRPETRERRLAKIVAELAG
ncbi:YdeI/OmpD-associated family protein [Amycolatopsis sp. NPDC051372]|uniref:YdeI/OmpD-associated family protein n=1 Tax=Amycolatopsis sp. NPDC051372 TaxID=3155669 RepID=UPI003443CC36